MSLDELEPDGLYHLATTDEWADYQARQVIDPASLGGEGFVHCSYGRQVAGTVERHFAGVTGLLALAIDPAALGTIPLVVEDSYASGQAYPHAYGPIPVGAVTGLVEVA